MQGYQEGVIRFAPTFKVVPGSNAYNSQRVPSWTDRILFKIASQRKQQRVGVTQLYYESVIQVDTSDHKPVCGGFVVTRTSCAAEDDGEEGSPSRRGCSVM